MRERKVWGGVKESAGGKLVVRRARALRSAVAVEVEEDMVSFAAWKVGI